MRFTARQAIGGLLIAGVAGAFLFLPAIVYIGTFLSPEQISPSRTPVPRAIGDALWAKAYGGRSTSLEPINPFTVGRMAACHAVAEVTNEDRAAQDAQHEECMKLMPGLVAVGYVSAMHLRGEGVWQDPRVPFVQLATMTRMTDRWTRDELIDTLAERGELPDGGRGIEHGAQVFFGRAAADLTLPEAALLAALIGDRRADVWCIPAELAVRRRRILERMRDNGSLDGPTFDAANAAGLGLTDPPPDHKPCREE